MPEDDSARMEELLADLKPAGPEWVPIHPGLFADECRWFLAAVDARLVAFQECGRGCSRLRRQGIPGPDEFTTPSGQLRHLYSAPGSENLRLNREYLPHIAAYAYAILGLGYLPERSAFSRYRTFSGDRIFKRAGGSYETDAEFYDASGHLYLQIEVKTWPEDIERMGAVLDEIAELRRLPTTVAKEVEYVLDLAPRHLWIVGPGTIDPPAHVFRVEVDGQNAHFERLEDLPRAG